MKSKLIAAGLVALGLGFVPTNAHADTLVMTCVVNSCTIGGNNSGGDPVSATAVFTFGAGTINVVLTNTLGQALNKDVGQNISGLFFTVSSGQTSGSVNASSSGGSTNVDASKIAAPAGAVSPGWILNPFAGTLDLCVICNSGATAGPEQTILGGTGTGLYTLANGSIANNGPHNPFLYGPVNFNLNVAGVTANTNLSSAQMMFGTTFSGPNPPVPEPTSLLLLGTGMLGGAKVLARRRKSKSQS